MTTRPNTNQEAQKSISDNGNSNIEMEEPSSNGKDNQQKISYIPQTVSNSDNREPSSTVNRTI
ncbi:9705_t:CDS:2 [Acaulospora colombiana]|uniref:9705_t:CDS:1 n=1 Tax=Acaulospora colombiana TaxID=27376 RepID=A0ACA9JUT9_9GLOM|nr:9705_t:CDS:2 [Acaulospora colombiana]